MTTGLRPRTLKRRREFLAVAQRGRKWVTPGLILQAGPSRQAEAGEPPLTIGYTASRKVGGAVQRNRAKRRLRALARELMPGAVPADRDYVLIARAATVDRDYATLRGDLAQAMKRLRLTAETDRAETGRADADRNSKR